MNFLVYTIVNNTWIDLSKMIQFCDHVMHLFFCFSLSELSYCVRIFGWFNRENATADKVKEAHRKVMVANHPDAGGSHYLASKINEAKDVMLGKTKDGGSAF